MASTQPPFNGAPSPVPVILDFDQDSDCDDTGDLGMLCAFQKQGLAQILGVIATSANVYAAACAKALLNYSLPGNNIPIAQYNGGYALPTTSPYTDMVMGRFGKFGDNACNYPAHVATYRQILSSAPNGSVVIVCSGTGASISDLLNSAADSVSSLTGLQLVTQKVKALYWEAGWWPSNASLSQSAEYNIATDIPAAQNIIAQWPSSVPVYWLGDEVGNNIMTGPPTYTDSLLSPYRLAYDRTVGSGNLRPAWGQTAVYAAVVGLGAFFKVAGANGTVTIDASGNNTWSSTPGPHSYVEFVSSAQYAPCAAEFNRILQQTTSAPINAGASVYPQADFSAVAGLISWGRPSDASTVTGSGASLAVADLAPGGHSAVVPASGGGTNPTPTGPTVVTNNLNGYQVLQFDGVANQLDISWVATAMSGVPVPFHAFFVLNITQGGVEQRIFDLTTTGQPTHYLNRFAGTASSDNPPILQGARVGSVSTGISPAYPVGPAMNLNAWAIAEIAFDPNNGTYNQNVVSVSGWHCASAGNPQVLATLPLTIGRLMAGYNDDGEGDFPLKGYLAEWAFIKGQVLSGVERMKRLRYLNNRYALGLTF